MILSYPILYNLAATISCCMPSCNATITIYSFLLPIHAACFSERISYALFTTLSISAFSSINPAIVYLSDSLAKNFLPKSPQPYINKVFEKLLDNPEQQKQLIMKMKKNLERTSRRNKMLSIKGIDLEKGESSK